MRERKRDGDEQKRVREEDRDEEMRDKIGRRI
jgi:hypothetical protein